MVKLKPCLKHSFMTQPGPPGRPMFNYLQAFLISCSETTMLNYLKFSIQISVVKIYHVIIRLEEL